MAHIFCLVCAIHNLLLLLNSSWISAYVMAFWIRCITDIKLLHFKLSKSGQILCVDKTCFPRPSNICSCLEGVEHAKPCLTLAINL